MKHFVKEVFFVGAQEVGKIIPFPVWKIPFPVFETTFGLVGKSYRHFVKGVFWFLFELLLLCYFFGWGGVGGEVGNKANTAPVQVGVKVWAELGKILFNSPKHPH